MRWTRLASGMLACRTKTLAAYGEVVWSWRRDPGATLAVSPAGNGGKKGRFPGESTYKPSNHCAGKAGMSRLYLSNPCAFLLPIAHGAEGAASAGLPCALCGSEGQRDCKTRAK